MRVFRASVWPCCAVAWALLCAVATADETFPYTAYVTSDDVYVRSGPGKNYYPTEKLVRGSEVEVYRHDPGGWFAIRPPQGSFAWVVGSDVRLLPDRAGVAEVAKDHTLAFVGSRFSDVRDVRQVKLDRGELVEIVGEKRFVADGSSKAETWYRIAPPAGEFRWVAGKFVTRQGHAVPNATADAGTPASRGRKPSEETRTEGIVQTQQATPPGADAPGSPLAAVERNEVVALPTGVMQDSAVRPAAYEESAQPARSAPPTRTARATLPQERRTASGREAVSLPTAPAGAPANSLQMELDDINLKLSLMIAEEPTTWKLDALKSRAKAALNASRSALDRGRASTLLREIAKYEQIRTQYSASAALRQQTEQRNELLANSAAVAAESVAPVAADTTKFDGVGRLTPVHSRRPGAPRFALTDAKGNVVTFVTPEAELPLANYVGRVIGLTGQRGYMPQLGKPHLTAKRITELDATVLK
ncbi:MAG: hypothetical protein K8T91_27280 [Planctomycetes bacterium]|nr:hypothetical protein [Planctomycetota bacterium]